jgi:hypothetical protein
MLTADMTGYVEVEAMPIYGRDGQIMRRSSVWSSESVPQSPPKSKLFDGFKNMFGGKKPSEKPT